MQIASYNLNGIRSALNKGLIDWLASTQIDLIGFQETKAWQEQVDTQAFKNLGYTHEYWVEAQKKGYSGLAVFSKFPADKVVVGMNNPEFDAEGRVLRLDFGDWTLINSYWPSGTSGDLRQEAKYRFLDAFFDYTQTLLQTRPKLLIQGDFNIAHTELDIHNPKGNLKTSGFLPEERAWLSKFLSELQLQDTFRQLQNQTQKYSWWSMRSATARAQNKGWRIDYQCVSQALWPQVRQADLLNQAQHSDHCPCWLELQA